jgi:hypothetical protein
MIPDCAQSLPIAVTSILFMTFINIIFCFPTSPQTTTASMNYCTFALRARIPFDADCVRTAVVVMSGVTFGSLAWYYFPVYGGAQWFTGPVRTAEGELSVKESTVLEVEGEKDRKDAVSEDGSS